MSPKEARRLVGRTIVAVDPGGSWEMDEHGGNRTFMHFPQITLDDGSVLVFHAEEHPTGDCTYGTCIIRRRKKSPPEKK